MNSLRTTNICAQKSADYIKTALFIIVSAMFIFLSALLLFACDGSVNANDLVKCEAELAVVTPIMTNGSYVTSGNSRSEYQTSNNKYVGSLKEGTVITWVFSADDDGDADLYFAVANAVANADSFSAGNGSGYTITLNGQSVNTPSEVIYAASAYCDAWQLIKIPSVDVKSGFNFVVLTVTDTVNGAINVDYLGIKSRISVAPHIHYTSDFKTIEIREATCTEGGIIYKNCPTCGLEYLYDTTDALGHHMGYYRYDSTTKKAVRTCERCGETEEISINAEYVAEIYDDDTEAEPSLRTIKTQFEAEDATINTPAGLNNGRKPVEIDQSASSGELVANISVLGNSLEFSISSSEACVCDLSLRLANTLYLSTGIGEIEDCSDYLDVTINNTDVCMTIVNLAGNITFNYYNWQYMIIKDVKLVAGQNKLTITPKNYNSATNGETAVSMPNVDVLNIYTDDPCIIAPKKNYDITGASINNDYDAGDKYQSEFIGADYVRTLNSDKDYDGDIVITVTADEDCSLGNNSLSLLYNERSIDVSTLQLEQGVNRIILSGVGVQSGVNTFNVISGGGLAVTDIFAYTEVKIYPPKIAEIIDEYDYMTNQGIKVPDQILEAENADLGDSVPSQNQLTARNNSDSGGVHVENMGRDGNAIEWTFNLDTEMSVDIVLRVACTNYNSEIGGNMTMTDLGSFVTVTVDGLATDMSDINLECRNSSDWTNWKAVVFKNFDISAGAHKVKMSYKATNFPNVDVMYIYKSVNT